ncbi:hypothetical protein [Chryseobacterium kwangjuense]|uniref:Uncharacterized protein n=1 Tax=Chryseobacterium kwangjuense TaxID=267125 RepID=A0A135WM23_9FLAO|nr:hypothetical protein [Chryseobacterium kwangjuense]KXH85822.1 hypothetical protein AU378_08795 [Chryseobacterium kwangjuense]
MSDNIDFELKINETHFSSYDSYINCGYLCSNDLSLTSRTSLNIKINFTKADFHIPIYEMARNYYEKEQVYITAIRNLLKQKRYLSLVYELSNDYISEDEFNEELENNEDNYLIKVNNRLDSINKVNNLISVINKIDVSFEEEDLLEIFSISGSLMYKSLLSHKIQNSEIDDKVSP